MSEEDLIKKKLAELFTEALLSDAARDTRSNFSGRIASEFLERISETMGVHQNGLREETQKLTEVLKAMASERAELESVVDRFAAAPIAKAGVEELRGASSGGFGEGEEPKANGSPNTFRSTTLNQKSDGTEEAGQAPSAPAPGGSGAGPLTYLSEAPVALKISMFLMVVLFGILAFVAVWATWLREPEVSTDTADLKQICAAFSRYKSEARTVPPPTKQTTDAQSVVDGTPSNSPLASVEYVLADKCQQGGAGGQTAIASPSGTPAPDATSTKKPTSGPETASPKK